MSRRSPAVLLATFLAVVLVAGCALPATEEGFLEGFCEADVAFETAAAAVVEIEDREAWIEATGEAMLAFRDDLDRLPAWEPARDAKGQLMAALDAVVRLVGSGAAGELVETPQWGNAVEDMLAARDNLRAVAGPCVRN